MGANMSVKAFQFINDIHIAIGSGFLGFLIYVYQGMNKTTLQMLCIGSVIAGLTLYAFSDNEIIEISPDKVIFISGCDSGLGFSLAQHACDIGFTVLAGCLNLNSEGAVFLDRKYNKQIVLIELDLTNSESIKNAVHQVDIFLQVNDPSELWALINNAGVMVFGEFEWLTDRLIKQQLDINVMGTMALTKACLPLLRRYSGRIVTISSHCAKATLPGLAVYGATKAALAGWNDALRVELSKYGIKVISFIPGSFVQQSNIMAKQNDNVLEMNNAMTEEQKQFYGDYFRDYNEYLSSLSGLKKPKKIEDNELYSIFQQILTEKYPSAIYIHESWKYKMYHILFKISPWRVRDFLVDYFVQMPRFRRNRRYVTNVIG